MKRYSTSGLTLWISGALVAVSMLLPTQHAEAKYPRDGVFKQLPEARDYWYYVDKYNWEIVAPDKWTHMMGSMGTTALLSQCMNKYLAGGLVLALGVYKEYDDAFREGWSYRDILADATGIVASLTANKKYRLLCDYDTDRVILKISITLH